MKHFKQLVCEPIDGLTEEDRIAIAMDAAADANPYKLNEKGVCPNCNGNYFYDIGVTECPYCVAGYKVRGQWLRSR